MTRTEAAPDSRSIRIVHAALIAGVVLFLVVALVVRRGVEPPAGPPLHLFLFAAAGPVLLLALVMRSRIPVRSAAQPLDAWWREHYAQAIVVWSLIEGASFLGIVAFWLTGRAAPLAATGVGLLLFLATSPRRLTGE